jgi:hypothetical protein
MNSPFVYCTMAALLTFSGCALDDTPGAASPDGDGASVGPAGSALDAIPASSGGGSDVADTLALSPRTQFGVLRSSEVAGSFNGKVYFWDHCTSSGNRVEYIFLEDAASTCGSGTQLGFAALTTNTSGQHLIEVCSFVGTTTMIIDPANATGGSTGILQFWSDPEGGGCKLSGPKGYPMRKFQATTDIPFATRQSSCWDVPFEKQPGGGC